MSSASTLSTVAFIYKRVYSTHQIADIALRDHVWYAMINKEDGFDGHSFFYPVRYGNPQGISGAFATAQTNASGSKGLQLQAYRTAKFGVVTVDGESLRAAKSNKGAFMDLITMETDRVIEEMGDRLAFDFYRDTYCLRGRGASAAGNVITLAEPTDARNFKVGMVIISDNTATGASPNSGTTTVSAVDEDAGTVTLANTGSISGFAATDYLFCEGDPGTGMEGLEVCTPLSAPVYSSDSFRGVDRGVDPRRLAGSRLDDTSLNAEVALGRLAVKISHLGKSHNVDQAFLNPTHFFNMAQRLNAKVEYSDGGGTANIGFQHITIHTAAGAIKVYSDPDCPLNRGRVSRDGSQYIKHLGGLPHVIDDDGNMSLRQTTSNGVETRIEAFSNLIQDDPSAQGVCSLATS
jgi:hypothetical protein